MEISLIRHGRSKFKENNRITCTDFRNWIVMYDYSGVFEEKSYPLETLKKIANTNIVMTSDLNRSVESAKILNPKVEMISVSIFRETELPDLLTKLWGIKLNPSIWAVILRCLWLFGYSRGCESISRAKKRAKKASRLLVDYAEEHDSVVLIGHGFFNMLIAKELKKLGWKGKRKTSAKHWSCTTYCLQYL